MANDANSSPVPASYQIALQRAQTRARELEQFIDWEDELFSNSQLSTTHKLAIRATRRAVQRGQTKDQAGRTRINMRSIAEQIGVSPDTVSRGVKFLQACGVIEDRENKTEIQEETGERWTRVYVSLNEEKLSKPKEITPPEPRKQGGDRYQCQKCSERGCKCKGEKIKIRTTRTLVCKCCNHEVELDTTERDLSPEKQVASEPNASIPPCQEDDQNLEAQDAFSENEEGTHIIRTPKSLESEKQVASTAHTSIEGHEHQGLEQPCALDGEKEVHTLQAQSRSQKQVASTPNDAFALTQLEDTSNGSGKSNLRPLLKPERGGMGTDATVPQVADAQNGSSCSRSQDDQGGDSPDADSKGVGTGYPLDDPQASLNAAAELLLTLAGPTPEHIEMARTGKAKYYTIKRPLTLSDILDHLRGGKAHGALCCYPENKTCGMCWDTDDTGSDDGWQVLQDAMRVLSENGYLPILSPSPAGRGGHTWVIFDGLVDALEARSHVLSLAPALATYKEYWPGPKGSESSWNKVRLPGGRYTRPGVNAWCQLISVSDGEMATCGAESAQLLLQHQTPAGIVPIKASQANFGEATKVTEETRKVPSGTLPVPSATQAPNASHSKVGTPTSTPPSEVDPAWLARYGNTPEGKKLWFAFTPRFIADWYNARHSVEDLLPSEGNGYGLASWRGERTASVKKRSEHWTDFGASARRDDGSPDGGDALELQVRVSQAPKPEVLQQIVREELLPVAVPALEQAALSGQAPPSDFIIRPAGYRHYARLAEQAGHHNQAREARAKASQIEQAEAQILQSSDSHQIDGGCEMSQEARVDTNFTLAHPPLEEKRSTPPMGGLSGFSSSGTDQDQQSKMPTGTTFESGVRRPNIGTVPTNGTTVPPFTEGATFASEVKRSDAGPAPLKGATAPDTVPQLPNSASAVPHSQAESVSHALAECYHLQQGEPCPKCACELYRDLEGSWHCCRCYPPRGYHQYKATIDQLYPRKYRL
jgi:hypothetical protein